MGSVVPGLFRVPLAMYGGSGVHVEIASGAFCKTPTVENLRVFPFPVTPIGASLETKSRSDLKASFSVAINLRRATGSGQQRFNG